MDLFQTWQWHCRGAGMQLITFSVGLAETEAAPHSDSNKSAVLTFDTVRTITQKSVWVPKWK